MRQGKGPSSARSWSPVSGANPKRISPRSRSGIQRPSPAARTDLFGRIQESVHYTVLVITAEEIDIRRRSMTIKATDEPLPMPR